MQFYKHKETGKVIPGDSLDILNPDTAKNYEQHDDYHLEYLSRISEKLNIISTIVLIQFVGGIAAALYLVFF